MFSVGICRKVSTSCLVALFLFLIIEQALFFVGLCHWFVRFFTSFLAVLGLRAFKMFVTPLQKELPTGCHAYKTRTRAFK